jgi:hypothetical protein
MPIGSRAVDAEHFSRLFQRHARKVSELDDFGGRRVLLGEL